MRSTETSAPSRRITNSGIATVAADGTPLDIWFPAPRFEPSLHSPGSREISRDHLASALGESHARLAGVDEVRQVRRIPLQVTSDLDEAPMDLYDVYHRFHLLSHRWVRPRELDLGGFIERLNHDVAWTSLGPCAAADLESVRLRAVMAGHYLSVRGIFPVPSLLDHVALTDVRIADASRVLLGAYLAPGTALTPEGFCGVNAGTLGPCAVEGRISAGVVVHGGSHIGGGSSLMGTISGGNGHVVTVGARCLIGANGGTGVSLGDDCVIAAGCYVTGSMPIALETGVQVKAIELAGRPNLTFRRNARHGHMEAVTRTKPWGSLNPSLHRTASVPDAT